TAADLIGLIEDLEAGPATVIADSFSPAAALWAAADRPDLVDGVVAISVHLEAGSFLQNLAVTALLRGPMAAGMWAK
ncbi:MAG: alpha/beta hydrolase, partial [Actinobacteria bacterium]|nr:alpha/beta hydrolase [Actinomycetota bacterium]NIS35766.1 alpha/beta hydrolase [Actinomycetota bacterium]NIU70392.1 alpha/beta hydrolase [Actinomycetota bacterium]NIV58493.1 alpha/beta hydrolase [Actinomycetota bacterium]NIV90056.1 alpha/beta hydrolase [Actinomycetota bacterium]